MLVSHLAYKTNSICQRIKPKLFYDHFNKKATLIVSLVPVTDWHLYFPDPT
jgi:hypothetical protein